eukprot:GILJ01002262.1.p1 GENE.GILJ01002262.1~~GILJ01002262.1.p1  ORF type:complete len:288 (+),score=45.93 GILJ01002262.1:33-866(+)
MEEAKPVKAKRTRSKSPKKSRRSKDPSVMASMKEPIVKTQPIGADFLARERAKQKVKEHHKWWQISDPQDLKDLLVSSAMMLVNAFKFIMACLLLLFVPQSCNLDTSDHPCTLDDNLQNPTALAKAVLIFNFVTLFAMLVTQAFEWKREQWIIEYLDEDDDKGDHYLPYVIDSYPDFKQELRAHNYRVFVLNTICFVLLIANTIISAVFIIHRQYGGVRSLTVLATNVLLVFTKVQKSAQWTYEGLRKGFAFSLIKLEPVSYNVIDKDHDRTLMNKA